MSGEGGRKARFFFPFASLRRISDNERPSRPGSHATLSREAAAAAADATAERKSTEINTRAYKPAIKSRFRTANEKGKKRERERCTCTEPSFSRGFAGRRGAITRTRVLLITLIQRYLPFDVIASATARARARGIIAENFNENPISYSFFLPLFVTHTPSHMVGLYVRSRAERATLIL